MTSHCFLPLKGPGGVPVSNPNTPGNLGHVVGFQTRLVIPVLEGAVQWYLQRGLAPSTHKTYQTGICKFINFCNQFHICNPIPVSQHLLCYYAACLASLGLSPVTVKSHLAAVRHLQVTEGFPEPSKCKSLARLRLLETGIQKEFTRPPRTRLPITQAILRQIRRLWEPHAAEFQGM